MYVAHASWSLPSSLNGSVFQARAAAATSSSYELSAGSATVATGTVAPVSSTHSDSSAWTALAPCASSAAFVAVDGGISRVNFATCEANVEGSIRSGFEPGSDADASAITLSSAL